MKKRLVTPDRVHLIAPANPVSKDLVRFGYSDVRAYVAAIRAALPTGLRLTTSPALLTAAEDPARGGRRDDTARAADINAALRDPRTRAIVAASGGAYLTRILQRLDWRPLARRRHALAVLGFSEITSLTNLAARQAGGRGLYGLCPNYLGWKVEPPGAARAAFEAFWRALPQWLDLADGQADGGVWGLQAQRFSGKPRAGVTQLAGGCLSVLAACIADPAFCRARPRGCWLALEDVNEAPHRIDRHLAALQLAGWLGAAAGVLVGDFHTREDADQRALVGEMLRFHLPADTPVLLTRDFGHVWPMQPLPLRRDLHLRRVRGGWRFCLPK